MSCKLLLLCALIMGVTHEMNGETELSILRALLKEVRLKRACAQQEGHPSTELFAQEKQLVIQLYNIIYEQMGKPIQND